MTNLTIAVVLFLMETNWGTTHVVTPVMGYSGDSTTFYFQTASVERVEYRVDTVKGVEKRREVDREIMIALCTNIPPRLWPTNAPPSMLGSVPVLLRHRSQAAPVPVPPVPPGGANR